MNASLKPLPSSDSARDLILGQTDDAIIRVIAHAAGRSVLCGVGCYAAGLRGNDLFRAAIGSALAIEVFALTWFWAQTLGNTPPAGTQP